MTTDLLLAVIAQAPTQAHVAYPYALSIVEKGIDVSKVNHAIIDRWSHVGLNRIKALAWAIGESMNAIGDLDDSCDSPDAVDAEGRVR